MKTIDNQPHPEKGRLQRQTGKSVRYPSMKQADALEVIPTVATSFGEAITHLKNKRFLYTLGSYNR